MAAKPLTSEAIALTEKKMDMTLDDIIKMSKNTTNKDKKQRVPNTLTRVSNKSAKFMNNAAQGNPANLRQFMNSRSSLRQGALAQKRSNFQGNQFRLATEAARKTAVAPMRNRPFNRSRAVDMIKPRVVGPPVQRRAANGGVGPPVQRRAANGGFAVKRSQQVNVVLKQRPQTLDSLFANMKEQRMRVSVQQYNNGGRQNGGGRQRQQWGRGRFGN